MTKFRKKPVEVEAAAFRTERVDANLHVALQNIWLESVVSFVLTRCKHQVDARLPYFEGRAAIDTSVQPAIQRHDDLKTLEHGSLYLKHTPRHDRFHRHHHVCGELS